jgi:molecular chaperone DnaJ
MSKRCFYETLGVERAAKEADLKSAFRKKAMECHPDRNPGDATAQGRFQEINVAYETLKDPQKRAAYDRFGHAAFENGGGMGGFGTADFGAGMADIFESMFGDIMGRRGGGRTSAATRGSDLRYNMEISLEDAFAGKVAQVRMPTPVTCEGCGGSGAKAGCKAHSCQTCGGQGKIRSNSGIFLMERTCPACQGRGEVCDDPCTSCSGQGRVTRERTLQVNIPPGVEEGTRIRLGGEGEAGMRGGPAGDLYIFLSIAPHSFFQRDGADLYCRVPVPMTEATLGGQIEVPTIAGESEKVKIAEGTQSGKQFRIKGRGMPVLRSREIGDLYIQVDVEIPKNLSKRQRELLEEFRQVSSEANHPEATGFFARVKDLFGARDG